MDSIIIKINEDKIVEYKNNRASLVDKLKQENLSNEEKTKINEEIIEIQSRIISAKKNIIREYNKLKTLQVNELSKIIDNLIKLELTEDQRNELEQAQEKLKVNVENLDSSIKKEIESSEIETKILDQLLDGKDILEIFEPREETKDAPEAAETKDAPEAAETKDAPEATETKDAPEAAETKDAPEAAETKDAPEVPKTKADTRRYNFKVIGKRFLLAVPGGIAGLTAGAFVAPLLFSVSAPLVLIASGTIGGVLTFLAAGKKFKLIKDQPYSKMHGFGKKEKKKTPGSTKEKETEKTPEKKETPVPTKEKETETAPEKKETTMLTEAQIYAEQEQKLNEQIEKILNAEKVGNYRLSLLHARYTNQIELLTRLIEFKENQKDVDRLELRTLKVQLIKMQKKLKTYESKSKASKLSSKLNKFKFTVKEQQEILSKKIDTGEGIISRAATGSKLGIYSALTKVTTWGLQKYDTKYVGRKISVQKSNARIGDFFGTYRDDLIEYEERKKTR